MFISPRIDNVVPLKTTALQGHLESMRIGIEDLDTLYRGFKLLMQLKDLMHTKLHAESTAV